MHGSNSTTLHSPRQLGVLVLLFCDVLVRTTGVRGHIQSSPIAKRNSRQVTIASDGKIGSQNAQNV